jgi:carbamoyltransferase
MRTLGIATLGPGVAVALLGSGGISVAIEEEKLARTADSRGVPANALRAVLSSSALSLADVDSIAVTGFHGPGKSSRRNAHQEAAFAHLRQMLGGRRFSRFDHHLCHAASAFYTSGFSSALILTLDHGAGGTCGSVCTGADDQIKTLHSMTFPNSFGWFYSRATQLAGLRPNRDEHKLQWLSKDGQPRYADVFREFFTWSAKGLPVLNRKYFSAGPDGSGVFPPRLYRELGLSREASSLDHAQRAAIARSAQDILEELVLRLVQNFRHATEADTLCLAGGLFQNVLLARALEKRSGFRNVCVQPVAGNVGTALGAAFLSRKKLTGRSGAAPLSSLALGLEPTSQEIKSVLDNCKIVYRYPQSDEHLLEETSHLLNAGKIVAWCQGRNEFGHRALGQRSLLASPFNEYVVDNVNQFIKHREDFHPFALSVPAERAAEFFDCWPNCRFMASLGDLKNPIAGLERFTFNGRAVRVHAVEREASPMFWRLLHRFGESAPAPILVNTSFNLFGEPLVTDPRSAVRSFYCSGIDALAIGPFLVVK